MHHRIGFITSLGILILVVAVSGQANAQTITTLLSFSGSNGATPGGSLTLSGSTFFGTTRYGGANNDGTVFNLPVTGGNPTILVSFNTFTNGSGPSCTLTLSGSTLYGTTGSGGVNVPYDGSVFSLPVTGGKLTTLASFNDTNGKYPEGGLTLSGVTLYGMTIDGGVNGLGNVFSIYAAGGNPATLLSFNGTNGEYPEGDLTLNGSTLYGMAAGGGTYGDGTVFSIPLSGGTPKILLSFNGSNGANPYGDLTLNGSTFYGMTAGGGTYGDGTVFSLPVNGGTPTTLLSFNWTNGATPYGTLTLSGSTLFGMTEDGGAYGDGTIFSLPVTGGTPKTLLSFSGSNGAYPPGNVTLSGSTLYGMTTFGGAHNDGTVFALNIAPACINLSSVPNATIITGGSASFGTTVSNSPSSGYDLNYSLTAAVTGGSASVGAITSGTGSLAPGGSQSCTASATSTTLGVTTISLTGSDPNASNSPQTTTATLTVLDHAAAAFAGGGGMLNLTFGTLQLGSGTQELQYQIENLPATYRAGLALDSVTALSDPGGVFSTDAAPFADLAPGATSGLFNLFLNTSQIGEFSGEYQFNLSDEMDLSGHAGQQTLTLNVTADVVPEPSTLALLAAGAVGLVGYGWRRRRAVRRPILSKRSMRSGCQGTQFAAVSFTSLVVTSVMLAATPLCAASYSWSTLSGDWSSTANWSASLLPTSSDYAYIANGGTANVTQLGESCGTLSLGDGTGTGWVQMTGGSISAQYQCIGDTGTGTFAQSGGASKSWDIYLGNNAGAVGTYTLSGPSQINSTYEYVGYSGTGSLTQSGGTNTMLSAFICGNNAGSSGTCTLLNGLLSDVGEDVGLYGNGTFVQAGGTNQINNSSFSAGYAGGTGSYTLSAGLFSAGWIERIGESGGTGTFTQSGGTNIMANQYYTGWGLYLGDEYGSSGTYSLSGSGVLSCPFEYVSSTGFANFTQTGGSNSAQTVWIGYYADYGTPVGSGTYSLAGGVLAVNTLYVGGTRGTSGAFNLSGSGLLSCVTENLGTPGVGVFTQTGGTNSMASLMLEYNLGSATYNLDGGVLAVSSTLCQALGAPPAFNFSGGTIHFGGNMSVNVPMTLGGSGVGPCFDTGGFNVTLANSLAGSGTLTKVDSGTLALAGSNSYTGTTNINGGVLTLANSAALAGGGPITFGGGTLQFTASNDNDYSARITGSAGPISIDTNSFGVTFASNLDSSNSGGLTKIGGGTLILAGSNSYTGTTNINGGVLTLANSAALAGGGPITFGGGTMQFTASNDNDYSARITGSAGPISINTNSFGVTLASNLDSSNSGGLTKVGGGTLILAGSNSYTGTTNINGGVLSLANSAALPLGGAITFAGGTLQYTSSNSMDYSAEIVGSTRPISIDTGGVNVMFSSSLASSNTGGFTKIGSGTLTIAASNALSGETLVSGGVLALASPLALRYSTLATSGTGSLSFGTLTSATLGGLTGSGSLNLANAASAPVALNVGDNNASTVFSGEITGPGGIYKTGSGTLALVGDNVYTGNTVVGSGMVVLITSMAMQDSTLDTSGSGLLAFQDLLTTATLGGLTGPGTLDIVNSLSGAVALSVGNNNTSTAFPGSVVGRGSLTKIGSGTLVVSGSNTYTGPTTINAGKLVVNGSLVSLATVNSGGILSGTGSLSSVSVSPGGAIAPGSPLGTLRVNGSLDLATGALLDYDLNMPSTSGMVTCGNLVLASPLGFSNFNFAYTSNFAPGVYDLIQANSLSGNVLGGSTSGTVDGYAANLAIQGNNLVLNVVPEPSTLALLAAGAVGLMGYVWRRRRSYR